MFNFYNNIMNKVKIIIALTAFMIIFNNCNTKTNKFTLMIRDTNQPDRPNINQPYDDEGEENYPLQNPPLIHKNNNQYIIKNKNINKKNNQGNAPLHQYIKDGDIDNIKLLLKKSNLNINVKDNNEWKSPLHIAVKEDNLLITKLLLSSKNKTHLNINSKDKTLKTPLHFAVQIGSLNLVKLLLENGADPNIRDNKNCLPIDLTNQNTKIYSILHKITTQNKKKIISSNFNDKPEKKDAFNWCCETCTFINSNKDLVCKMCSIPKFNKKTNFSITDWECLVCSLINPEKLSSCNACGNLRVLMNKKSENIPKNYQDEKSESVIDLYGPVDFDNSDIINIEEKQENDNHEILENTYDFDHFNKYIELKDRIKDYKNDFFPYHKAIIAGDLEDLVSMMNELHNINLVNENGETLLYTACQYNRYTIVKKLIELNANIEKSSNKYMTPLLIACQSDSLRILKLLLENGAKIDVYDEHGNTSLHLACTYNCNINLIKFLILNKVDINAINNENKTPLLSIEEYNVEAFKFLIKEGADVNTTDKQGMLPLYSAVKLCDIKLVKYIISKMEIYDPDLRLKIYNKSLILSCVFKSLEKVKFFLSLGAQINKPIEKGGSFSEFGLQINKPKDGFFLEFGPQINKAIDPFGPQINKAIDPFGPQINKAIHPFGLQTNKPKDGFFLESGPQINKPIDPFNKPIPFINKPDPFINKPIYPFKDPFTYYNNTPLIAASSEEDNLEIIKYLIDQGADIDSNYGDGTAIEKACKNGNIEAVKFLLLKNAKHNIRILLDLALVSAHLELIRFLIYKLSYIDEKNYNGYTALHSVCRFCYNQDNGLAIVKFLIDRGADRTITDSNGCTPLQIAIIFNKDKIIKYLQSLDGDENEIEANIIQTGINTLKSNLFSKIKSWMI